MGLHMFDNDLMAFDGTTTISASASSGAIDVGGTPSMGLGMRVVIPSDAGSACGIKARVLHSSASAGSYEEIASSGGSVSCNGGVDMVVPFHTAKRYIKCHLELSGSGNAGKVAAGVVSGVDRSWVRRMFGYG